MAFTKIAAAGIGSTELVTLHSLEVLNNATVGGVLTYEDVTNVDSIGIITARAGVLVGSGITLSKDGDIFATGVTTSTTFVGDLTGNVTGNTSGTAGGLTGTPNISVGTIAGSTGTFSGAISGTTAAFSQNIAIRLTSATNNLHVHQDDSDKSLLQFSNNTTGSTSGDGFQIGISGGEEAIIDMKETEPIIFSTAGTERLRINSDGRIAINDTGLASYSTHSPCLAIGDSGDSTPGLILRGSATSNCDISFCDNSGSESDDGVSEGLIRYEHSNDAMIIHTADTERIRIASDGKLFTTRTHASSNTGNHPALDIDTYSNNGSPAAAMATGIDFSVEGVHKKRLAVTYADANAGTGDWIFYRDQGNNKALQIDSSGNTSVIAGSLALGDPTNNVGMHIKNIGPGFLGPGSNVTISMGIAYAGGRAMVHAYKTSDVTKQTTYYADFQARGTSNGYRANERTVVQGSGVNYSVSDAAQGFKITNNESFTITYSLMIEIVGNIPF